MVWQSSTNKDTAFPWWYDEGTPLSRTCLFSLICFSSNLHVTGFSSCRITTMIHSYRVCVCLCVWNIWRDVKLLTCTWFFAWGSNLSLVFYLNSTKVSNLNFSRGMECASDVSIQRRRICCTVIWIGDAQSTYLLNLVHFRPWQPAKPSTGMSFFPTVFKPNDCTVFAIWLSCIRTS